MYGRNSFAPPSLMNIQAGPRAHGTYPGGRHGSAGRTVRLVPAAQFGGYPDRIHPGGGQSGGGRIGRLHE